MAAKDGGGAAEDTRKHLTAVAVAFTCYSLVCGGPVGIEAAVGSAGAFAAMAGLAAVAVLWALPQALMTAELATAIPTNGGSIDWVRRALGPVVGLCNAASLTFNQLFDLPLYPSLMAATLSQVVDMTPGAVAALQVSVVVVVVALNVVGMDAVASSATALTLFIMVPFLALPVVAAARSSDFEWHALAPAATIPDWQAQLPVFVSGILWNMQGWNGVGNLAAEIRAPQRSFPAGVTIAVALVTASYAYSILFGTVLHPDLADWEDGYFVNVASQVASWLGVWSTIAAAVAQFSTCLSSMATYARSLQAAALAGYIPVPLLARDATRWRTPVPAILLLGAATLGLMYVDLSSLILLDTTFSNISTVYTTIAFLVLRRAEPAMPRPFIVAGGWRGAAAAAVPVLCLAIFAFYAVGSTAYALAVPLGANALIAGVAYAAMRFCPRRVPCLSHPTDPTGGDALPAYGDNTPLLSPSDTAAVHPLLPGATGASKMAPLVHAPSEAAFPVTIMRLSHASRLNSMEVDDGKPLHTV